MPCRRSPAHATSLAALQGHRAIHADGRESRRVWLFHSHAYLDHGVAERVAEARAFMDLVIRTFAGADHLEVHGFTPFPAGPHPRGSFEVLFTREAFADYVSWLMFSRPPRLDILVRPLTGSQLRDHTRRALWLGTPVAIDCAILEEADTVLSAAGRSEESIIEGTKRHGTVAPRGKEGLSAGELLSQAPCRHLLLPS